MTCEFCERMKWIRGAGHQALFEENGCILIAVLPFFTWHWYVLLCIWQIADAIWSKLEMEEALKESNGKAGTYAQKPVSR